MARRSAIPNVEINLIRILDVLQTLITPALCQAAFGRVRTTERQRKWSLEALVRFWTAVILRAPKALTQALVDSVERRDILFPLVDASPAAFFQRCRDLRPAFFAEVFHRFTARLLELAAPRYAAPTAAIQTRFAALVLIDGSRLDAIARRLKILWDERAVVLPGCLLAIYDLGRGLCRALYFAADAAAGETTRAKAALRDLVRDSLAIGDRLYCTADFFAALTEQHCWGLVRRHRALSLRKLERRRKCRYRGGRLEEWLVQAGSGQRVAVQSLRYIRWRHGSTRYELLTSVLDSRRLSAEEALLLYPYRWSIERMFFDLKEVLNLKHFYAANPNAVAMQVYAAAIVYNALRLAQSEAAAVGGIDPEEISPAKFYPKVAAACTLYLHRQQWEDEIRQRHPRTHFRLIGPEPWAHTGLPVVCREKRRGIRRKRRFCRARRRWKSLAHVRGGKRLIHLS
jgi:hypothetical protein